MHLPFVTWDHLLLLALLVGAVVEWRSLYPRFIRAAASSTPGARLRYYAFQIAILWAQAAWVVALWISTGRPWTALLLGASALWRLAIGWALAGAYIWLALYQRHALLAKPTRLARFMQSIGSAEALVPRTPGERRAFVAVSITAGITEELLFRGFVVWYASQWAGPVGGFLISSAIFGMMHVYLGARHVPRTAIAGAFFYAVAMSAGSLLPAMLAHAVADLVSGDVGFRAVTAGDSTAVAEPAAPAGAAT